MDQQILAWRRVASELGVRVVTPCQITLNSGQTFLATALVEVGPPNGIVVDTDWQVLRPHATALVDEGYGYSAISLDDDFDRSGMVEVLRDWGWTA